jgi:hypothetical protein
MPRRPVAYPAAYREQIIALARAGSPRGAARNDAHDATHDAVARVEW